MDENPYESMLQLHRICPDYTSNKPKSLAGITAVSLHKWLLKRDDDIELFDRCVSIELQKEAFHVATAKHTGHLKLFKEIFWLDKPELSNFIKDEIELLIERHMFKEAMDVVEQFNIREDYDLYAFIIPCFLQDKLSAVVKFIEHNVQTQKEFIAYLDSFVGMSESQVVDRLQEYKDSQIMTMQYERFTGKTIEKMIYKLATELGLQVESVAPNLFRSRKEGELRFKVQSRFYNQDLNDDAYFGHISEALKLGDDRLKSYFINFLTCHHHYEDAVRWVVYCNIPEYRWPARLCEYIMNNRGVLDDAELKIRRLENQAFDDEDTETELMPGYPIVIVKTWKQLSALMHQLNEESHIGIDSEWKPQYITPSESIALLQVATKDAVYLVDFCALEFDMNESQWSLFLRALLCTPIVKIGFDLTNDLRALFAGPSMANLRSILDELQNVVCIKMLVENLLEEDRQFFDCENLASSSSEDVLDEDGEGGSLLHFKLSDLSEKLLGVKLDKSEQCSNWAIRPLRASQKNYAAMDAYIVVELFLKLKASADARGIDFQAAVLKSMVTAKKKEKTKSKKGRVKIEDMPWAELCELKQIFPSRVLCIPNVCSLNPVEQLKFIFSKYRVSFSGQDVYSRCMECNGVCFVKVPGPVIQALFENVVICRSGFHDELFDISDWSERLANVDPRQHGGVGCRLLLCNSENLVVECHGGTLDIISNIVTHDHLEEGVDVIVRKVPEQIVSRPGNVFFLCGSCGKVYWDSEPRVS
ncbi:unnamed protein product [Nippostrongylus brasiliensis]|uniref:Exonuclease mut-7 (inferred by orthology to a C. elegans protein) n=1 Tax=Nippostrongylus brasiliensis TaxID=27835 RepID=A0A0N4Y7K0_NIPBR|nr:unnamed protein product [Nippostrongylus brasiliensis]